jgi:hypothetical protein
MNSYNLFWADALKQLNNKLKRFIFNIELEFIYLSILVGSLVDWLAGSSPFAVMGLCTLCDNIYKCVCCYNRYHCNAVKGFLGRMRKYL